MAKLTIAKINTSPNAARRRENSHVRLNARKIGLDIPEPSPSLPKTEVEAADIN